MNRIDDKCCVCATSFNSVGLSKTTIELITKHLFKRQELVLLLSENLKWHFRFCDKN